MNLVEENKSEFIVKIDKSKYMNIEIKGKMIPILNWYSAKAGREYFSSYKKDNDYRKAFCNLVFNMINKKNDEQDIINITIEDIELLSDDVLIKIMNTYLGNDKDLDNYFKDNFNGDYFETFYLAMKIKFDKMFKEMAKSISNSIQPIYAGMESIYESMKPIYNAIEIFQKNMQSIIKPAITAISEFYNSDFIERFSEISKQLQKFDEEIQQFKKIIVMLGFPPHEELMPYDISKIVSSFNNYGEEKAIEETYAIYNNYFNDERVKEMSSKWYKMNVLNKRRNIIRQAVKAHLQGNYYLSIPIVFSQIEGLVANIFNHKGQMTGKEYVDYLEKLLNDNDDYSYDDLINKFYSSIVLVSFQHNKPIKSFLSRHAIMHGGDTKYGTKINSIKALLLFDYIINKMNEYKSKESKELRNIN
jgi:hypothetical protein